MIFDALVPFTNDAEKHVERRGMFLWFLHLLDFLLGLTLLAIKYYRNILFHLMTSLVNNYFASQFLTCLGNVLNFRQIRLPCSPILPIEVDKVKIMVAIVVNALITTFVNGMALLRQIVVQRHNNNPRPLILLKSFLGSAGEFSIYIDAYNEYLQYKAVVHHTQPTTAIAQSSNPAAFVSQSSSLGPWILDSGVSDHMFGNKFLFS